MTNEELIEYFNELEKTMNGMIDQVQEVLDRLDELDNAVEKIQKYVYDINLEKGNDEDYTLLSAIRAVPDNRKILGLKIRFKRSGGYSEYSYVGTTLEADDWNKTSNWSAGNTNLIDGGTF